MLCGFRKNLPYRMVGEETDDMEEDTTPESDPYRFEVTAGPGLDEVWEKSHPKHLQEVTFMLAGIGKVSALITGHQWRGGAQLKLTGEFFSPSGRGPFNFTMIYDSHRRRGVVYPEGSFFRIQARPAV